MLIYTLEGFSIEPIPSVFSNDTVFADIYCYKDGKTDDAAILNELISHPEIRVIKFAKGTYLLESFHKHLYQVSKPYHLGIHRSNLQLIGEKGATLKTRTMAGTINVYSKPYDIDHRIENIVIQGITFEVENRDTLFHKEQEHCHTISMMGVNKLSIQKCRFLNFWGDAICLNHYGDNPHTGERQRNENIIITDNTIHGENGCNRNGISVINGFKVLINNNNLNKCSHRTMPGAIDIEPNYDFYSCSNIIIRGNTIRQSKGNNAAISLVCNKNGGTVNSVLIENNEIIDSNRGLEIAIETTNFSRNVTIINNTVDKKTEPFIFYGKGSAQNWKFERNKFKRKTPNKFGGSIRFTPKLLQ